MKILYKLVVDQDKINDPRICPDYQLDSLAHGLSELLGTDFVDYPQMNHLYEDYKKEVKLFSLYNLIKQERRAAGADRVNVINKIQNKYFDFVILAIHHTQNGQWLRIYDEVKFILKYYSPNEVVIIDGWDLPDVCAKIIPLCHYFKREVVQQTEGLVIPIQFAIPESKIREPSEKTQAFATNICCNFSWNHPHQQTYIHQNEDSYYDDMGRSFFAYNCKKGGWDCMRPYEQIAAGTIPYWLDIEDCPKYTMYNWPKGILEEVKKMRGIDPGFIDSKHRICDTRNVKVGGGSIDFHTFDRSLYFGYLNTLQQYMRQHLTTKALAKRVLTTLEVLK